MATNKKVTWHNGDVECENITVSESMTIQGGLTFGDASTDTFTCNGLSTFNANMDINAKLDVDMTSTSGNAVDIANAGTGATMKVANSATNSATTVFEIEGSSTAAGATGAGLLIDMNSTGDGGAALEIDDENTGGTSNCVKVASAKTGTIAIIDAEGNAAVVVEVQNAGTGKSLLIDANSTGDPRIALEIDDEATGNSSACVQIASKRTDVVAYIVSEGVGSPLIVLQNGTNTANGKSLFVNQDSTHASCSYNLHIDDESTGATASILVDSTRTGSLVLIDNTAANATDGIVEIQVINGSTGSALLVDHNETDGNAVGIHVDVASTVANAFAFKVTGIATNAGIFQTNVSTDCAIDNCTGVIRIQSGSSTYYVPCLNTFT